jgi:hypothetical protein
LANEHIDLRDTWAKEGIWIVKPRAETVGGERGATDQAALIASSMNDICAETGANVVIWDTITGSARAILNEQSELRAKQSSAKSIKHTSRVGADHYVPSREARFLTQDLLRLNIRDTMLMTRKYHLVHILHQETAKKAAGKDQAGEQIFVPTAHGCNAGGPGSVELYGTEWQAVHRLYVDKNGQRKLQVNQYSDRNGVPFLCRTNTGGAPLPNDIDIPDNDYGKTLAIYAKILEAMGLDLAAPEKHGYFSLALHGLSGCGKTRLASTLLGLDGVTGCVYVAADGDSEYIRSFWNEVKQAKETK